MSQPSLLVDRQLARGLTLAQGVVVLLVVLMTGAMGNMVWAKSAGLGAFIGWLGSAYFAWQAFRYAGAGASKRILGSFYRGMIGKFILITFGFAVVFGSVRPLSAAAVLIGFVMVQIMAWIYPLWSAKQRTS
jgi:ATP synthase protein I